MFSMTYRRVAAKRGGPRLRFITEIIAELRRVVWLSRREVAYLTALVLIVTITVGLILGIIDFSFTKLFDNIILGG